MSLLLKTVLKMSMSLHGGLLNQPPRLEQRAPK